MKRLHLYALASLLALPLAVAQTAPSAVQPTPTTAPVDLPVTKVVLFSSGVGYFEHTGEVQNDTTMRLMFKTEQINDVLKSMILMDFDGGQAASVTYGANEPVQRALRSFGVDISSNPTFPDLLGQLRGAKVFVSIPEKVSGSILNVDSRVKVIGQPPTQVTEFVLNLVTETGIRAIPLDSISSLQLADQKLQEELSQALSLLVSARDTDRKPVEVRFAGVGKRKVLASYLVETPVWKSSYRLDLNGKKPILQGWAIVENTSESDWKEVELSLTSGRPISFIQDLYTPLYVRRQVVVPERYASLAPRIYDDGIAANVGIVERLQAAAPPAAPPRAGGAALAVGGRGGAGGGAGGGGRGAAAAPSAQAALLADSTLSRSIQLGTGVQAMAAGAEVGELFRFTLTTPLSLARRRSAMIPIVNESVAAEKVSIYNQSVLAANPLNGAYLTNSTKLKLLGGPVTVFDGGAYAGDAQLDHMEKDERRLISYAVDLAVTVDPSQNNSSRIFSAVIVKGVLTIIRVQTWTQTYRIHNKAESDKVVLVEHPFIASRSLIEPKSFEEKTPSVYRFRVPVKAGDRGDFKVVQEEAYTQAIQMFDQDVTAFAWAVTSGEIPPTVRTALQKAIDLKNAITEAERQLNLLETQLTTIKSDQERIRQNIEAAGRDTPIGRDWLETLSQQETQIRDLQGKPGVLSDTGKVGAARENILKKRAELDEYLRNLSV